jgi:hypothetical protein
MILKKELEILIIHQQIIYNYLELLKFNYHNNILREEDIERIVAEFDTQTTLFKRLIHKTLTYKLSKIKRFIIESISFRHRK